MKVLSLCCGMGLLDRAFLDAGFEVTPGCEVDPRMRRLYSQVCGGEPLAESLCDLIGMLEDAPRDFDGVIGGPPCQSHTRLRAMRSPKFPDLTPQVAQLLGVVQPRWFLFENVASLRIHGAKTARLDAMHYARPHQSRARWFTFSPNLSPPPPVYRGTVDDLLAYSIVAGRIYGRKRAAVLQGWPFAATLDAPPLDVVLGLANAVHYGVGSAWARAVREVAA